MSDSDGWVPKRHDGEKLTYVARWLDNPHSRRYTSKRANRFCHDWVRPFRFSSSTSILFDLSVCLFVPARGRERDIMLGRLDEPAFGYIDFGYDFGATRGFLFWFLDTIPDIGYDWLTD